MGIVKNGIEKSSCGKQCLNTVNECEYEGFFVFQSKQGNRKNMVKKVDGNDWGENWEGFGNKA
jgi:hypothetical protein